MTLAGAELFGAHLTKRRITVPREVLQNILQRLKDGLKPLPIVAETFGDALVDELQNLEHGPIIAFSENSGFPFPALKGPKNITFFVDKTYVDFVLAINT